MDEPNKSSVIQPRIILFGSERGFSRPVFEQLLARNLTVTAVVMMDSISSNNNFPVPIKQVVSLGGLEEIAQKSKVDILKTHSLSDEIFISQLIEKQAEVFLVACFAQKIPACIWQKMNIPCWNLHPSLLPKYRGPSPLYWQINNNEADTGLTLHEVSSRFDAGDIVARKSLPLPVNHDTKSLNFWVAEQGVDMFQQALFRYADGKLNAKPQDEMSASCFPYIA